MWAAKKVIHKMSEKSFCSNFCLEVENLKRASGEMSNKVNRTIYSPFHRFRAG
jgi:hypothetical protein